MLLSLGEFSFPHPSSLPDERSMAVKALSESPCLNNKIRVRSRTESNGYSKDNGVPKLLIETQSYCVTKRDSPTLNIHLHCRPARVMS